MLRRSTRMGSANSSLFNRAASSKEVDKPSTLDQLRKIYSKFHFQCRHCGIPFSSHELKINIKTLLNSERVHSLVPIYLSALTCMTCRSTTCIGCGRQPTKNKKNQVISLGTFNSCCEQGRLLVIWLALCQFDESELELQSRRDNAKKSIVLRSTHDSGVGYARGYSEDGDDEDLAIIERNEDSDGPMISTLIFLNSILPTGSSISPPTCPSDELILFRASFLLDGVCALIRNDSISDLTERSHLYYAVFTFIESVANYSPLTQILFEPQPSRKASPGLRALCDGSTESQHDLRLPEGQSPSLFTCFNNTYRQASFFLDLSKSVKRGRSKLGSFADSTDMCKTIVKLYSLLEKLAHLASDTYSVEEVKDPWAEFSEKNRVTFTDDVLINHRFTKAFPSLKCSTRDRMLIIGREISSMTTSLPAGVFIKVAESRSDVMKVLMVGVEGSPYAGGLFTFDLLLPQNYPNSPPKMAFVLEGVDNENPAMNPNLHNGGTICLSILNTWTGDYNQMWQPRKSTILAVLVSIQAMILGAPLPWLNEPGYSDQGETPQAIEHKLLVQIKTLRYAMIAWLTKIKQSDRKITKDIWQEIIEVYWNHNGQNVLNTVELWATENSLIKSYNKLTAASMGLFALNMEPLRPNNMEPEPVTENLFQTLQELIRMEPSGKAEPNAESPLETSDDKALNLSAGPSSAPSSTSGETISKSSLEGTEKGTHHGKRKASIGTSDSKNGNNAEGSKRQKAKSAKENYKADDSDYKKSLNSLSNNYPQQNGVMDDLDVLENLIDVEAQDQSKATAELNGYVKKWVYTGDRTLKAVRAACEDFGITPARSITKSIARLERHINDEGGINDNTAFVYGAIVDAFEGAGEEE